MREMLKNAGILLAITVIAGFVLGAVYQITKEPIALAKEAAAMAAYREVFADAADFNELEVKADALVQGGIVGSDINNVFEALGSDGTLLGYVLVVTNHEGYGGDIQFSIGIANDGTTNGISILAIAETPGLGMNAQSVLVPQFENVPATIFTYTKTGSTKDSEIDAISGATITTKAIVNAVKEK